MSRTLASDRGQRPRLLPLEAASCGEPRRRILRCMSDAPRRRIWRTRRALGATAAIIVWFPGCLIAAWWQVNVALAGDSLGWLYSVEWPVFACFGLYFWWFWIHDDPSDLGRRKLLKLKAS